MSINYKNISLAFLINIISPFWVFSADLGVRGFVMGERYSTVLKQEQSLGEFTLRSSQDDTRLVFNGNVFGEKALITYAFRAKRLSSMRYVWDISTENPLFIKSLKSMLAKKYLLANSKSLDTLKGSFEYFLYAGKENIPSLLVELEIFPSDDADFPLTIVLEFRAPDPDTVLMKKILNEDL